MIVVYSGNRGWRSAVEQALKGHDVPVRTASRPAELAKCLADGAVRLIVVGADEHTVREAQRAAGAVPLLTTSPGDTTAEVVRRAIDAM